MQAKVEMDSGVGHINWLRLHHRNMSTAAVIARRLSWLALIPSIAVYYGLSQTGWQLGGSMVHYMTTDSALWVAIGLYIGTFLAVLCNGYAIYWMEKTYGSSSNIDTCMVFGVYISSPLMMAGVVLFWPQLGLVVSAYLLAVCLALYLMFTGLPIMMEVPEDKGVLYGMSILTVSLCVFVGAMITMIVIFSSLIPIKII